MELGIRIQSLEGFRILGAVSGFQSAGFRIPQQKFDAIWIPEAKMSPDSGGVVSGQKQATVYSCSRRTNGKFVIEPLNQHVGKFHSDFLRRYFVVWQLILYQVPKDCPFVKFKW